MKSSKVFSLVQGLQPKQSTQMAKTVMAHKRVSIRILFKLFSDLKTVVEPTANHVFEVIFEKPYTKANDYMLRNEYRLLYSWMIEELLRPVKGKAKIETDEVLMYLLDNQHYDAFEDELSQARKLGKQKDDVKALLSLMDFEIQYCLKSKGQSQSNAAYMASLCKQRIDLLAQHFLREVRKEEIHLKMSERILSAYSPLFIPSEPLTSVDLLASEQQDVCAQYFSLRARINFAKGTEKIDLLKRILEDEDLIRKYEPNPQEALCRFWFNIGQECYMAGQFLEAIAYYQKTLFGFDALPVHFQEALVFNYVYSLLRNENYELARELADKHSQLLLSSQILASRSRFLLAVLHLYDRDADGAERFVTIDGKKEGSEFYFFMRIVLSAIYYLRGKYDLAEREIMNIDQAVNYEMSREMTLQTQISKSIVSLFKRFYMLVQKTPTERRSDELRVLMGELSKSIITVGGYSNSSVLTHWLRKEIERWRP